MSWIVRVALLLCLVVPIYSYSLYGVAGEWQPNSAFTYITTVKIDRTTGQVTNVTTNAKCIDYVPSLQGMSAFDEEEGIFYSASYPQEGPIRLTDVVNKNPLPSLEIHSESQYVFGVTYDNARHKLYVLYQIDEWFFVLEAGSVTARYVVFQFPATANWHPHAAMDTKSGTYFLITGVGITKSPVYEISSVDVATGNIVRTVRVDSRTCPGAFMFVEYDNTTKTLMGGGRSASENSGYFFFRVDPKTGRCTKRDLPINGRVYNWAYDSRTQELLYIQDDAPDQKLGTYNIRTGSLGVPVFLRGVYYVASMEVTMFH